MHRQNSDITYSDKGVVTKHEPHDTDSVTASLNQLTGSDCCLYHEAQSSFAGGALSHKFTVMADRSPEMYNVFVQFQIA